MKKGIFTRLYIDFKNILLIAMWFGLVTGLVEGVGLFVAHKLGIPAYQLAIRAISLETIWISPLFDLFLFGVIGLALGLMARSLPRLPALRVSWFLFSVLGIFDWLMIVLYGRVHIYGVFVLALGLAVQLARWFHRHRNATVRFARRSLPWLAMLAVLALVGIQGGFRLQERAAIARLPTPSPVSPNILVIVIDTLRADHLSGHGYARRTSPNMDRLAQQGVLFENAFSTSPTTQASHASLLTGLYTYQHGAGIRPLDRRYPTIGEALQARGYRTGAFSANVWFFTRRQGFGRGFIRFEDNFHSISDMAANTLYGFVMDYYVLRRAIHFGGVIARKRAPAINQSALRWIDQDPGKPFFVFLNYFDVHDPYPPPQPYRSRFSVMENPGGLINSFVGRYYPEMTPEQLQAEIDAYDGAIAYVDDHIAQLLAELQKRGLAENTLVVITSDHGELFGEHGMYHHSNALYRGVIHVPLIFWWPGHVPAGVYVAPPVSNVALPATLLDLIGEGEQTPFPGPSLAHLWQDTDFDMDWPYPLAEMHQNGVAPPQHLSYHGAMKSLVSPQWQYIVHEKLGEELYDWRTDPVESTNLAKSPELQPVVDQFRAHLGTLVASVVAWLR